LPASTRERFESRLGVDLSTVRTHEGARAAASADALGALAYTLGHHVVFGGAYEPASADGHRLLAHELAHTAQQRPGPAPSGLEVGRVDDPAERDAERFASTGARVPMVRGQNVLRRACGPAAIGKPSGCTPATGDVQGETFHFRVACDEFRTSPGPTDEHARLIAFASGFDAGDQITIHGFASEEGDPGFNVLLSCARAQAARAVIAAGAPAVMPTLFMHGATAGDRDDRRSVVIVRTPGPGAEPKPVVTDGGPGKDRTVTKQVTTEHKLDPDEAARRVDQPKDSPPKSAPTGATPASTGDDDKPGWGVDLQVQPSANIRARDLYDPSHPDTPRAAPAWRRGFSERAGDFALPLNLVIVRRDFYRFGDKTLNYIYEPQLVLTPLSFSPRPGDDPWHWQPAVALATDVVHWKVSKALDWHILQASGLLQGDKPLRPGERGVAGIGGQVGTGFEYGLGETFTVGGNLSGQALRTSDGAFSVTFAGSIFVTWHIRDK
jgi:hypothetical protein